MLEREWIQMIEVMNDRGTLSPFALKLYNEFGSQVFGRSVIPLCYAENVFDYCLYNKGINTILDIGTGNGIPAAYMSIYCKNLVTIDIVDNKIQNDIYKFLGIDNITVIKIDSEREKEEFLSCLKFDFCYMDGAHANYTYSDWMMVRKCGNVLFHEYYECQRPVFDLVNSLPENEVTRFVKHDIRYPKDTILSEVPCVDFAYWEKK